MDKFAMVYEFNKESPLITYKAVRELEAKNYKKAVDLLSSAIEKYPYHPTPYFQYALALAHNKQYDLAKDFLKKGDDLLGEEETLRYYLNLIDAVKREADGITVGFDDTINEVLGESFIEHEQFNSDDIDLIDETSSNPVETGNSESGEMPIITETLAEIYASQENYEEAIDIYEKLKSIKPDLVDKFNNRINELKTAIENKKQKRFGN
jgi:tetratricopeptide (TPR) repeat protein